jgi:hypothetical protein
MGRLGDLAEAQQPVLRDLGAASGDLNTFLARLRPFAEAGTPAFEALGEASVVGRRAVRRSEQEIAELRKLARDAPAVAKPLRQFLQTIDDRERAVEPDPRAPGGRGFTGMEAIWNYFYWQALTTNPLDDIGHVLRLNIVTELACAQYTNAPSPESIDTCNQFLGPNQPGVTTPDPTLGTAPASSQLLDYVMAP